jgi:hypothetical protein
MIGITITAEAYAAIKATLPADTLTWPTSPGGRGDVVIWLDQATVDRLDAIRGPGESYSDAILRPGGSGLSADKSNGAGPESMSGNSVISAKLVGLHHCEEQLRAKALDVVQGDQRLQLHLAVVEATMDLADVFRQLGTSDEDLKVIKILGMRTFNAFGASVKLALSGYGQNSALILRDVLETIFLIDYFAGDRTLIERWRLADKKARMKDFGPVKVREALDARDGFTKNRRFAVYEMFSELAGHPNMKSALMMRPLPDGDAVIGPFIEATSLEAVISEMGRLAIQVGEKIILFLPADWSQGLPSRLAFAKLKHRWIATFYPTAARPTPGESTAT